MARDQGPFVNWSQYLAARLGAMGLLMFDADANLRTAGVVGRLMHRVDKRHRERARAAIARSFPEFTGEQVDRVVRASFEHFIKLAFEVLHTPRVMQLDTWAERIDIHNLGQSIVMLNRREPAIMLTGHLGNWEVCGYFLALLGYDVDAIARPIDNPLINDWLLGIREAKGMRIITKWDATERMLEVLNTGGALAFIADQNAGDRGMFVPFFGRLASSYKSIGLLAINQQTPIICGFAHRLEPDPATGRVYRYEIGVADVIRPDDWVDQPDPLYYVTARYARAIEMMVRRRPEQYLWMHRRWKSRPRHERQGKPMPKAMRRRLEQLPWMDDALMRRLEQPLDHA